MGDVIDLASRRAKRRPTAPKPGSLTDGVTCCLGCGKPRHLPENIRVCECGQVGTIVTFAGGFEACSPSGHLAITSVTANGITTS